MFSRSRFIIWALLLCPKSKTLSFFSHEFTNYFCEFVAVFLPQITQISTKFNYKKFTLADLADLADFLIEYIKNLREKII